MRPPSVFSILKLIVFVLVVEYANDDISGLGVDCIIVRSQLSFISFKSFHILLITHSAITGYGSSKINKIAHLSM